MQTFLIPGKKVADFDGKITAKLVLEVGTKESVNFERMQVGIRNENGDIYRAIGITGLDLLLDVVSRLVEIGLVDELEKESGSRDGYDAIFRIDCSR